MQTNDTVYIWNMTPDGKHFVEGKATLIERVPTPAYDIGFERWQVEFVGHPGEYFERDVWNSGAAQ